MVRFSVLAAFSLQVAFSQQVSAQQGKGSPAGAPQAVGSTASPAAPSTYEIAKGDTLFRIAGKVRSQGASLYQTILVLYRANADAFLDGNINQLIVGKVMSVPSLEATTSVDSAKAIEEVRALIARPSEPSPPPPAPPIREAPVPKPRPDPVDRKPVARFPALSAEQAAERLKEAIEHERRGDLGAALKAYVAAGEAGNGEAQKRLGDLYNTGNAVVRRDYETALKWYQKARAQGVEIPKPIVNPGARY